MAHRVLAGRVYFGEDGLFGWGGLLSVEVIVPVILLYFEKVGLFLLVIQPFDCGDRCHWQNFILLVQPIHHELTGLSEACLPSLVRRATA